MNPYVEVLSPAMLRAKLVLISELEGLATDEGWADPRLGMGTDIWTSVNVGAALLKAGCASAAQPWLIRSQIIGRLEELNKFSGLLTQGNRHIASANLTADCGIFMARLGDFDTARIIADHLAAKQLESGGWSISLADQVPRIRPTAQILRFFFELRIATTAQRHDERMRRAIRWLLANNTPGTSLWSNMARDKYPNLSASIWAFNALTNALAADLIDESDRYALDHLASELLALGENRAWVGVREDVVLATTSNEKEEKTGSGAVGLLVYTPSFWRYRSLRSATPDVDALGLKVSGRLIDRINSIHGPHLSISDEGSAPFTYNLGFALDAMTEIEAVLCAQLAARPAIEAFSEPSTASKPSAVPTTARSRVRDWLRSYAPWLGWAGLLAVGLLEIGRRTSDLPRWYSKLSGFWQGLFMAVVSVLIAGLAQLIWTLSRKLLARRTIT